MLFKRELQRFLLLTILLLLACGPTQDSEKLLIATSANMQYAMEELVAEFSNESGIPSQMVIGASGKLAAQITSGAPFAVFVAADTKYPEKLYQNGLCLAPPKVYAHGKLVLWTTRAAIAPNVNILDSKAIEHIAIANPTLAPYGKAAMEFMGNHQLLEKVRHKFVYGESIAQTNQFIVSGSADIGFTAQSVVLYSQLKQLGKWAQLDTSQYTPIAQAIVLLKNTELQEKRAEKFEKFLFSPKAKKILENFGYTVVK
ncbi:MAG: molybdate ABC transporter substrate-binding protein [Bacteroidota bacterium]